MNIDFPEGVRYLASESYAAGHYWQFTFLGVIFLIISIAGLWLIIHGIFFAEEGDLFVIAGIYVMIFFGAFSCIQNIHITYGTQYLVTTEPYILYSEIQKDYRIIEVKDNIITLRPHEFVPWVGEPD